MSDLAPLRIELPGQIVGLLAPSVEEAAQQAKELILVELFRRGEISAGKGGELLGISKWEFIQLLARHGVPYLDQTAEELEQDFQTSKAHSDRVRSRRPSPTADH